MDTKYFYVSTLNYDGGVYQTQIIDWLKIYRQNGLDFELIQFLSSDPRNKQYNKKQKESILKAVDFPVHFLYRLPTNFRLGGKINKLRFYKYIKKYLKKYNKVVLFSRSEIGPWVEKLKQGFPKQVVYYLDLRSALYPEYILNHKVNNTLSKSAFVNAAYIAFAEYKRQLLADKIFVVSNSLKKYFIDNYGSDKEKFVLYPCLSSSQKFYYDTNLREQTRKKLGYEPSDNVYVYSGGILNSYHIPDAFLTLFSRICEKDSDARILIIVKNISPELNRMIMDNNIDLNNVKILEAVPNKEIVAYLNAADFGFLLRQDIVVNNVASPSKYAEYMLCGLPTIVSESIHDWRDYCLETGSGIVFENKKLNDLKNCEIKPMDKKDYDRSIIAETAKKRLSKESVIERIVSEFKVK